MAAADLEPPTVRGWGSHIGNPFYILGLSDTEPYDDAKMFAAWQQRDTRYEPKTFVSTVRASRGSPWSSLPDEELEAIALCMRRQAWLAMQLLFIPDVRSKLTGRYKGASLSEFNFGLYVVPREGAWCPKCSSASSPRPLNTGLAVEKCLKCRSHFAVGELITSSGASEILKPFGAPPELPRPMFPPASAAHGQQQPSRAPAEPKVETPGPSTPSDAGRRGSSGKRGAPVSSAGEGAPAARKIKEEPASSEPKRVPASAFRNMAGVTRALAARNIDYNARATLDELRELLARDCVARGENIEHCGGVVPELLKRIREEAGNEAGEDEEAEEEEDEDEDDEDGEDEDVDQEVTEDEDAGPSKGGDEAAHPEPSGLKKRGARARKHRAEHAGTEAKESSEAPEADEEIAKDIEKAEIEDKDALKETFSNQSFFTPGGDFFIRTLQKHAKGIADKYKPTAKPAALGALVLLARKEKWKPCSGAKYAENWTNLPDSTLQQYLRRNPPSFLKKPLINLEAVRPPGRKARPPASSAKKEAIEELRPKRIAPAKGEAAAAMVGGADGSSSAPITRKKRGSGERDSESPAPAEARKRGRSGADEKDPPKTPEATAAEGSGDGAGPGPAGESAAAAEPIAKEEPAPALSSDKYKVEASIAGFFRAPPYKVENQFFEQQTYKEVIDFFREERTAPVSGATAARGEPTRVLSSDKIKVDAFVLGFFRAPPYEFGNSFFESQTYKEALDFYREERKKVKVAPESS
eukprot:tig00020553_g10517.t2